MNTLGNKIRVFRKLKGYSQLELELGIEASTGMISRIENDETNPSKETVMKMAKFMKLNSWELDYLIGITAFPPSQKEIEDAIKEVKDHMEKRFVFGYLMDDRNRLLYLSKGFRTIIESRGVKSSEVEKQYFTEFIINPRYGIRQFLDEKNFDLTAKDVFSNTYAEMYFMESDECYEEMIKLINQNEEAKYYWELAKTNDELRFRTLENRTIHFRYLSIPINLTYSIEPLRTNQRFRLIEYKPTNVLLRILKSIG